MVRKRTFRGRSSLKFSDLELHPSLNGAVEKLGFQDTTPVQAATMPHILEGRDVAGLAQTGTGKTAAFLLPLMERILRAGAPIENLTPEQTEQYGKRAFTDWKNGNCILVLVPTRELCEQVYENCVKLKGDSHIRAVSIYGGVSYDKQKQGLRDGVEFIIATPGRLIDLYKEHLVDMKQVRAIVFDEADRMFDMGFKDDMKYILQRVPKERQFLVFSATLNLDVLNTAYQFGANPVEVNVSRDQAKAENVADEIFHVGTEEKPMYLLTLIKKHQPRQTIIFSNFKMNVPRIAQFLNDNKVPAVGISSLLTQAQRTRVMEQFKADNDRNILVATDVAARGLDIKGVDMVINFELPDDAENYVHRIGRTGRAGEKGKAFSLVSDRDVESLQRIEDYLKHKVAQGWIEDSEFIREFNGIASDRGDRRGPRPPARGGSGGGRPDRGGRPQGGGGRGAERPAQQARSEGGGREGGRGGGGRGRDRSRPNQSPGGEPRSAGGESQPPQQHRDRQLGRHRGGEGHPGQPGQGRDQSRDQRPSVKPREQQRSASTGGGGQSRPQPRQGVNGKHPSTGPRQGGRSQQNGRGPTPVGASKASLGKKVSGFFKKLFGGEKKTEKR